jgi:hypothetical protein
MFALMRMFSAAAEDEETRARAATGRQAKAKESGHDPLSHVKSYMPTIGPEAFSPRDREGGKVRAEAPRRGENAGDSLFSGRHGFEASACHKDVSEMERDVSVMI